MNLFITMIEIYLLMTASILLTVLLHMTTTLLHSCNQIKYSNLPQGKKTKYI